MHTHIHTCTNAQKGKNTEFYDTEITLKMLKLLRIMLVPLDPLKLLKNNWPIDYAHLPRVQTPVYINMLNGVPGVHHKRRPQDMTKMTQNTLNYS